MAKQFERVGGGTYDVYREKKKSFWEKAGEVVGAVVVTGVGLAIVGAIIS